MSLMPRILSVGTANPPQSYSQEEVAGRYRIPDPRIASLFKSSHIQRRFLYLPEPGPGGLPDESQGQLLDKHVRGAQEIGPAAIRAALERAGIEPCDVDYLAVTTTTGFLAPGLSAYLINAMDLRRDCQRADVVGMGCNAGLNGLNAVANWARANPGKNAVLACVEVCSAAYVFDGTIPTGVVNSLFGDGAAAAVIRSDLSDETSVMPRLLGFNSHIIPDSVDLMRYHWDGRADKFSFFLDRDIPYSVGAELHIPVDGLLDRFGLKRRDIAHWIIHSGGKKVIDAAKYNLGLTAHQVRHTTSVLRDFGNLSSGSFLFSFERLLQEGVVRRGDYGLMMTMGPGVQIETALLRW